MGKSRTLGHWEHWGRAHSSLVHTGLFRKVPCPGMCVSVGQGPFSKKKMRTSWLGMELRVEGACVQGLKGGSALPGKSLKQRLTRQGRGLVLEYSRFSSMMMLLSNSLAHYSASETTASWASASELPPYVWCVNSLLQKFAVLTQDLLNVERKSHCTPETLFSSSWVTVEIFPFCLSVLRGAKNNIHPQKTQSPMSFHSPGLSSHVTGFVFIPAWLVSRGLL